MPQIVGLLSDRARRLFKVGVASCSAGAALVSILNFAQNQGLIFQPSVANAAGGSGKHAAVDAAWIGVAPEADTLAAIGDTLHLTARVADQTGGTVVGAPIAWSSDSAEIVTVSADGTVVARAPGTTTVFAAVGAKLARARVTVRQRVVGVRILGDSGLRVQVGQRRQLRQQALDARGNVVDRRPTVWEVSDTTVARVDSAGNALAVAPGRTNITVTVEGVTVRRELEVVDIPASLAAVSAAAQTALAGHTLTRPIEVEVLSERGQPVANVPVRFGVEGGDGFADPAVAQTDAKGHARARWTLGDAPGRQSLPISVDGVSAPLVLFAEAEPVAANLRATPLSDSPTGQVSVEVAGDVGLRLTDSLGRALAGVPVTWTARDGGSAVAVTPRTDSLGESRIHWTLGPKVGRQRALASIGAGRAIPNVTIAAYALPGAPAATVVIGGGGQSGTVGAPLSRPIALRVTDRNGNAVPEAQVTLLPAHGTVADSVLVSDSVGVVRASWTLGRSAGPQRLIARVAGVATPLTLAARARALRPANVAFPDSAVDGVAGKALAGPVGVTVTDAYGNPVPDVLVTFKSGAGAVTTSRVMTDADGRALTRWRLGATAGEQQLAATVKGMETRALLSVQAAAPPTYAARSPAATATKPAATTRAKPATTSKTRSSPSAKPAASKRAPAKPAATKRTTATTKSASRSR